MSWITRKKTIPDAVYVAAVSGIVVMAFGVIPRTPVGAAP